MSQYEGGYDAEYTATDRTFPRFFRGNTLEQFVFAKQHPRAI
jgi:hypothetical protein